MGFSLARPRLACLLLPPLFMFPPSPPPRLGFVCIPGDELISTAASTGAAATALWTVALPPIVNLKGGGWEVGASALSCQALMSLSR